MPRIKAKHRNAIRTRAEAEAATGRAVELQRDLNALTIEMDAKIHEIRIPYEDRVDRLNRDLNDAVLELEAWAQENPGEFPKDRKSIEFVHGKLGFRLGNHKIKRGKRYRTLQVLAEAMKAIPWARKYRKQPKATVNKELLIADRSTLTAEQLAQLDLQIVQDETFYIEPKDEELTQGMTAEA